MSDDYAARGGMQSVKVRRAKAAHRHAAKARIEASDAARRAELLAAEADRLTKQAWPDPVARTAALRRHLIEPPTAVAR